MDIDLNTSGPSCGVLTLLLSCLHRDDAAIAIN